MNFAVSVGEDRRKAQKSRDLIGEGPKLRTDIVGAMAEVAVCVFYGEDPRDQPYPWEGRWGNTPDLILRNHSVGVKGTEHWTGKLTLFVPALDPSDLFVLVSVDVEKQKCGLQGWASRSDLGGYEPVKDGWRMVRKIPVAALRECKEPS
jgi:hypothetical protein